MGGAPAAPLMSEDQFHEAVAQYLNIALPHASWWTTIANETPAGRGWTLKLKRHGVTPGTPDIVIVWDGRCYWIELKSDVGDESKEQIECHRRLRLAGQVVDICRTVAAVQCFLVSCGIPLRATVA